MLSRVRGEQAVRVVLLSCAVGFLWLGSILRGEVVTIVPMSPDGRFLSGCHVLRLTNMVTHQEVPATDVATNHFKLAVQGIYSVIWQCGDRLHVASNVQIDSSKEVVPVADVTRGDRVNVKPGTDILFRLRLLGDHDKATSAASGSAWMRITELITNNSVTIAVDSKGSASASVLPGLYSMTVADPAFGICALTIQVQSLPSTVDLNGARGCRVTNSNGLKVLGAVSLPPKAIDQDNSRSPAR